ncbi:MAG: hypothetical protein ACLP9L_39645 [Thermoguttaceae bacterium]
MRYQGVRVLDRAETQQLVWLLLSTVDCPNQSAERRVEDAYFLVPHGLWSWPAAFADQVSVRRTRRRILFSQRAGILP